MLTVNDGTLVALPYFCAVTPVAAIVVANPTLVTGPVKLPAGGNVIAMLPACVN